MSAVGQIAGLVRENFVLKTDLESQSISQLADMTALVQENSLLKIQANNLDFQLNGQNEQIALLTGIIQDESRRKGTIPMSDPMSAQVASITQESSALKTESVIQFLRHRANVAAVVEGNSLLKSKLIVCISQLTRQNGQIVFLTERVLAESRQKPTLSSQSTITQVAGLIQQNCFLRAKTGFQMASHQRSVVFFTQENDLLRQMQGKSVSQLARRSKRITTLMERIFNESRQGAVPAAQPSVPAYINGLIQENCFLRVESSLQLATQIDVMTDLTRENSFLREELNGATSQTICQMEQINFLMKLV
jgi:hypothetical protein